jgi:DNA-binding transcriptional regulator GbsR (MarR family)
MKRTTSAEISETHKRGIRATLLFVDEALCEIEQWARGRELRSELYEEVNTLSETQRQMLLAEVERVRNVIRHLRDSLGLEKERRSASVAVHSLSCGIWPHLEELKGKHLKRYGDISLEATEKLSESVEELIQATKRIADIARGVLPSEKAQESDEASEDPIS